MWRLLNLFKKYDYHVTIYAVAMAYLKNPLIAQACDDAGHETASHAHRWVNYRYMSAEEEEKLIREGVEAFQKCSKTGKAPVGWYYGRPSPRSRALLCKVYKDLGLELLYQADSAFFH